MPVEVDERQLAYLRNTEQTVKALLRNPKTRGPILAAYKAHNPNAAIPEIDTRQMMAQGFQQIRKEIGDFINSERTARQTKETQETLDRLKEAVENGRQMLRSRGYTDEGIKKVEEFRDAKGLLEYEDAVKLYEVDNPPAQISDNMGAMSMFNSVIAQDDSNEFHKRLFDSMGEDSGAVEREALNTIRDMRGATRR